MKPFSGKQIFRLLGLALLAMASPTLAAQNAEAPPWSFEGVERVVAIGDVHGAYPELLIVLRGAGLIDGENRWTGGDAHLVSVGDLLDRGAESRAAMDLFMRLQQQAALAGGAVHVVPGNHEIMNITDDLRYVAVGEYAAFASDEQQGWRDEAFARWLPENQVEGEDEAAARARFQAQFPPGFFAHRRAFAPDGYYGRWIMNLPYIVRVNDSVFVHGGLSERMAGKDGPSINALMRRDLNLYLGQTRKLREQDLFGPFADQDERFLEAMAAVEAADKPQPEGEADAEVVPLEDSGPSAEQLAAQRAYAELQKSPIFAPDGPLWYRGNAWCHPLWEPLRLDAVLAGLGAERVVVGHTPTSTRRVINRLEGRAILIDTGMLPYYEGRGSALEITAAGMRVYYADEQRWAGLSTAARRVGARPGDLTDDELEDFLRSAEIIKSEELGMGVTKPLRLTLQQDGITVRGVFKGEDTDISGGTGTRRNRRLNIADSYKHDIAAYRLDRYLGIDLVPVTVYREVDGRGGALQFWVEDSISTFEIREKNVAVYPVCDVQEQYDLMRIFDILIFNEDRNQTNVLFEKDRGLVRLIDHSRAFRTHSGRPASFKDSRIRMPLVLAERLRALDRDKLYELIGDYIGRKPMRALLKRRDQILKDAEILSAWPEQE